MASICGYLKQPTSKMAEECNKIRTKLACVQDPCCDLCPPFEEHKLSPAGMPTGTGESVAEALNWKKPNCVNACDSVPRGCVELAACPPPPPKLVIAACPPQLQQHQHTLGKQQKPDCPYLNSKGYYKNPGQIHPTPHFQPQMKQVDPPYYVMGSQVPSNSIVLIPVPQRSDNVAGKQEKKKYNCEPKQKRCKDDCPECPIEIHTRTIYPKCESMVPGYGGHVPGILTCKFGKTFGRETREALQKVYSTPQLKTLKQQKKC